MPDAKSIHRNSRWRAIVTERCPRCRVGRIFDGFVSMRRVCPVCGLKFEREPGYFVGSMYISYALAVIVIGILMTVAAWVLPSLSYLTLFIIAAVAFLPFVPFIFRYSRVLWMHFDRMVDPEPVDPTVPTITSRSTTNGHANGNGTTH